MTAATTVADTAPSLIDIVDFKWLMAGAGHRVHVEQLQSDPEYARRCLALAAGSRIATLRDAGRHLTLALGLAPTAA